MDQKDLARLDQEYKGRLRDHGSQNLIFIENQEKAPKHQNPGKTWWDFIRTENFLTRPAFCDLELQSVPGARRPNVFQLSIWYFLCKPYNDLKQAYFLRTAWKPRLVTPAGYSEILALHKSQWAKNVCYLFCPPKPLFLLGTRPWMILKHWHQVQDWNKHECWNLPLRHWDWCSSRKDFNSFRSWLFTGDWFRCSKPYPWILSYERVLWLTQK